MLMTSQSLFFACLVVHVLVIPTISPQSGAAHGQQQLTPNTLRFSADSAPRDVSLDQLAWLVGHWHGEGLGGECEEVWAAPMGGAMMGMFRMVRDDQVVFYEILTLAPREGNLTLRLKHFHPDLTGWEERDQVVEFPLVRIEDKRAWFNGLTFEQTSDDALTIYLAMRQSDGAQREERFRLYRLGSEAHRQWQENK